MVTSKDKELFEKTPVLSAILKLAIPAVLGQLILVIYNLADTFYVGLAASQSFFSDRGLSDALISGVTICMPVFMILTAISNLFGVGAASVMSRSNGKRNYDRATNASRFAFWGCLVTTLVYCLLIFALLNPITKFVAGNGNEMVQKYAKDYILVTVIICGIPTALNTLLSHLIRAEGKSFEASVGIAFGGILNVALDPLFIFGIFPIEDAALSAALATGVSNVIALIYYIVIMYRRKDETLISLRYSKEMFNASIPNEVLTIGLPACLMTLCENLSYMILDNLIGTCSAEAVINTMALAGVGAAKKMNMVAHSIARGMTQGVLPLIGYNKSSGRRIRMKKIVFTATGITTGVALVCMILNFIFATPLCSIFNLSAESIDGGLGSLGYASLYLIIFSIGAPFSAFAYSVISFFQAIGKAWRSLILALLRKGILDIPLMYILPTFLNKQNGFEYGVGVVAATPIADCICCIVAIVLFAIYLKGHARKDKEIIED